LYDPFLVETSSAAPSRNLSKAEKAHIKRLAKNEEEKTRRAEIRRTDPDAKPCSACGSWDHERRSNKDCPHYIPKRAMLTPLTRTSVIKCSLEGCCRNNQLKRLMIDCVISSRTTTHVASLFMQHLCISRLSQGLPMVPLNQTFCYQAFCQLIGKGSTAPSWVKEEYRRFSSLVPENVKQQFNKSTALMSVCAAEYATNAVNHVVANFEGKSVLYFFIRFNNNNDIWHLENATVANRKKIALYCYHKAAQLEAHWPSNLPETVTQASIDEFADSIDLGPCPITDASLSSKAHLYLPWMYKVLDVIERKVAIKEPKAQTYASKAYIFRNLKEVSIIPCQSELSVLLIN
jgi:ribosomal protein L32